MIYLLEDDDSIRELVCYSLGKTGYPATGFSCPSDFYRALSEELPQLVLLDVMLPEEDGMSVLRRLRVDGRTAKLPVIMLTAKGSEFDKVSALDAGADDYVVKPFGVMELVARVKAVLRRTARSGADEGELHRAGDILLSVSRREVSAGGEAVSLTFKEFELLLLLMNNRGRVVTREKILSEVWGYDFEGESRTVDVHIRTLRQKLGTPGDIIETVRGVGYKLIG